MNANFNQSDLLSYVCNLYLMDLNYKSNCACHNICVIRLEADRSMIDTLAKGVPVIESSSADLLVNPYLIRYPPNSTIGYGYFILCEY
jgi:hypothetical protein